MQKFYVISLIFIFVISFSIAQDIELPDLEIITPENVERLDELAYWQGVDDGMAVATFSPDGKTLALALNDGTIQLLDAETLQLERVLEGADFEGFQLRYSKDGTRLLLSNYWDGDYRLWDIDSGVAISEYHYKPDDSWSETDSDLQVLAIYNRNHTISILDFATKELSVRFDSVDRFPMPQLNHNGTLLMTGDADSNIFVWDTNTGEQVFLFPPQLDEPTPNCCRIRLQGFGFSPDGTMMWANWRDFLIGREEDQNRSIIQFWDVITGEPLFTMEGGGGHRNMIFDPTGSIILTVGEADNLSINVWIWDFITKQLIIDGVSDGGWAKFSPDGQLLVYGIASTSWVEIYNIASPLYPLITFDVAESVPEFSPDGRFLLLTFPGVRLFGVPFG
jgi:WD40 repeat protein